MISYSSGIAVYRQVADIFREQINSGELTEGTTLPSYKTLSLHYNVSIETVQKAIGILRNEGRLDVFRGKQAQVRPARAVETITAPPQARVSVRMPTPDERIKLNINEGVPILVVRCAHTEQIYAGDRHALLLK